MNFIKTFLACVLAYVVGNFVLVFVWIIFLAGIAGVMMGSKGGPVNISDQSILKIDLNENIVEKASTDPFASFDFRSMSSNSELTLFDALRAIDAAGTDDRIRGIYLRMDGGGGMSMAALEELRDALRDFRTESGKFIYAYNEIYSEASYCLASVADRIYLYPQGSVDWHGLSFNTMFFKGLLDKLDASVEIFRPTACKFKSAVEPYFRTDMSEANREQMNALARSMWSVLRGWVAESRDIEPAELDRYADELSVVLPEDALKCGLVDGLKYEDQMDEVFDEAGVARNSDDTFDFVTLGEYASQVTLPSHNEKDPKLAVVYAQGSIVDGNGSESETIYGTSMAALLRDIRLDDEVQAVVLRVNSPGGSALASDVIWREIQLLRAEKPVIVSMGAYAASGGYYISCPADAILADELTLTGSIGVFGMIPNFGNTLKNKLGITVDGVKTNASADMSVLRALTPVEKTAIMRSVDRIYSTFTNYVAEGRNLPLEKVLDLAGGRVWSGRDAVEIGLADANGGLMAAIDVAAEKAGLESYRIEEVVEQPDGLAAFLSSILNARVQSWAERAQLGGLGDEYRRVREALSQQGVLMYCPYIFRFE